MVLKCYMLEKPTPVTHLCRPVTYQPITEFKPTEKKLVHDVNKGLITDIGFLLSGKRLFVTFTNLHFSHFVTLLKGGSRNLPL